MVGLIVWHWLHGTTSARLPMHGTICSSMAKKPRLNVVELVVLVLVETSYCHLGLEH